MRRCDEGGGVKEEGRCGGLGSDLDPYPWKILWIRQNYADPDPHQW